MLNPFRHKRAGDTPPPPEFLLLPAPHPASLDDEALAAQCSFSKDKAGGPGGQHRNKVESRVTIVHNPTGIEAMAGERRSAVDNRRVALFRLRLALALGARTPVPPGDPRSALWQARCSRGKIACNPQHHDYPTLLAEALDTIWACDLDLATAALRLTCSASQLVKLIKEHPAALVLLNQSRASRGMHKLH
jgi:hypothetical protein